MIRKTFLLWICIIPYMSLSQNISSKEIFKAKINLTKTVTLSTNKILQETTTNKITNVIVSSDPDTVKINSNVTTQVQTSTNTNVAGVLLDNTVWTKAKSPYQLIGHVHIPRNVTLTIESGVKILFENDENYEIFVKGFLHIQGTNEDNVIFIRPTSLSFNYKYMITFRGTNLSKSSIKYTQFIGSKRTIWLARTYEDKLKNTNQLIIQYSTFDDTQIEIQSSNLIFKYCTFNNTQIKSKLSPQLIFKNSTLYNTQIESESAQITFESLKFVSSYINSRSSQFIVQYSSMNATQIKSTASQWTGNSSGFISTQIVIQSSKLTCESCNFLTTEMKSISDEITLVSCNLIETQIKSKSSQLNLQNSTLTDTQFESESEIRSDSEFPDQFKFEYCTLNHTLFTTLGNYDSERIFSEYAIHSLTIANSTVIDSMVFNQYRGIKIIELISNDFRNITIEGATRSINMTIDKCKGDDVSIIWNDASIWLYDYSDKINLEINNTNLTNILIRDASKNGKKVFLNTYQTSLINASILSSIDGYNVGKNYIKIISSKFTIIQPMNIETGLIQCSSISSSEQNSNSTGIYANSISMINSSMFNFNVALHINGYKTFMCSITHSNFYNNLMYNIKNFDDLDVNATGNWWGTTNRIPEKLFDYWKNIHYGEILYDNYTKNYIHQRC